MKKLFLFVGFLLLGLRLSAVCPSPYTEGVSFSIIFTGFGGGGSMTVYDNAGSPSASCSVSGSPSESSVATAWVRPGKQCNFGFSGNLIGSYNAGSHQYDFNANYRMSFTAPAGYSLYLNGVETDVYVRNFALSQGSPSLPINDSYTLELRPLSSSGRAEAGSFSGIDLGKSVTWEIGLGGLRTGRSAGQILFKETDLTNPPTSRDRLYYTAPANNSQITVVKDGVSNQTLRQVSTPQTVVDLLDDVSGGYWFKFYTPAQATWTGSLYTFVGQTAWRTIRVEAPSAGQLKITETEGAVSRVSSLTLTSGTIASGTYVWTLQEGDTSTWLRTTTHTSTIPAGGQRDEVVAVRTGGTGGTIVAQTKYHYVAQAWGEEVTQIVADPSGSALTTNYTYHSTNTAYGNYRKMQSMTDVTGNWTSYAYYDDWNRRGQLSLQTRPYVSTPATAQAAALSVGDSVSFDYSADTTGRYRILTNRQNYTGNVQTGKQLTTRTINLSRNSINYTSRQATDYSAAAASVQTTSEISDSNNANPDFLGFMLSIKRPDQSQDSYAYYRGTYSSPIFTASGSGTYFRTNVWHGTTNSSGATSFTTYDSSTIATIYLIANKSTMDVTVKNPAGLVVRQETHVYTGGTSFTLISFQDFTYDGAGRCTQSLGSNNATTTSTFTNGRLVSTIDASGIESQFTYDELGRVKTSIKKGAATSGSYAAQGDVYSYSTYDGAGHVVESVTTNAGSKPTLPGGSLDLFTTATYDLAGRVTQQVVNAGASNTTNRLTTSFAYSVATRTTTATLPGGATKITEDYLDGQLKNVSGTAVVAAACTYSIDGAGRHARQSTYGGISSAVNSYSDWLGRSTEESSIGGDGSWITKMSYYNSNGQLWKSTQTGAAATLYVYDTLGRPYRQGLDVNGNDSLDLTGSDRITESSVAINVYDAGTTWWTEARSYAYAASGSGTATLTGITYDRLNLGSNVLAEKWVNDIAGNRTYGVVTVDRANKKITSTTDTPDSTINAVQVAYNGLGVETTDTSGVNMKYGYDALGRMSQSTDPRIGTSSTAYLAGTSMVATATDAASVVQATYAYDSAGRVQSAKNALNKYTYYDYTTRNEKSKEWGDATYPVEYVFDALGRQTQMKTYAGSGANFTTSTWPGSPGTASTTTWSYHATTGLLSSKTDAASKSVSFTYKPARQVATRTWARGVVTTYAYSSTTAELTGVTYSDSTPAVTYTYNRLGQTDTVADNTGTRTFTYNLGGTLELQNEILGSGFYGDRRITRSYDTATGVVGRYNKISVGNSTVVGADVYYGYRYDSSGRFNGVLNFDYSYVPNSHLVQTVSCPSWNYTDTRTYDAHHDWTAQRTTSIGSTVKGQFVYTMDAMGRTTAITKTGELCNRYGNGTQGLDVNYGYNDRSELTSEQTKLGGSATVLTGRDDSYVFDQLGNRTSATHNSNTASYTTNSLNQYSSRVVPGIFDVAGAAATGATVTVNTQSTTRHGEYFFKGFGLSNSPNPVNTTLAVFDGTTTTNLSAFLAGTPEAMSYDFDGNLLSDGRWDYTYDAENRLVSMQTHTSLSPGTIPNADAQRLEFNYDYQNRRVEKIVRGGYNGSTFTSVTTDLKYLYDGNNVLFEYNALASMARVRTFIWGLDLSGASQGAGGIGGLLLTYDYAVTSLWYIPIYDAMGNVHGLINYSNGSIAAAYEYDVFGKVLRASGPYAASNLIGYSTKYTDIETGLVYYGQRYYSPSMGRFINRDPIEESGGVNLYGFCGNNGVNGYDYLGYATIDPWGPRPAPVPLAPAVLPADYDPNAVWTSSDPDMQNALNYLRNELAGGEGGAMRSSARWMDANMYAAPDPGPVDMSDPSNYAGGRKKKSNDNEGTTTTEGTTGRGSGYDHSEIGSDGRETSVMKPYIVTGWSFTDTVGLYQYTGNSKGTGAGVQPGQATTNADGVVMLPTFKVIGVPDSSGLFAISGALYETGRLRVEYEMLAKGLFDKDSRINLQNFYRSKQTTFGQAYTKEVLENRLRKSMKSPSKTNFGVNKVGMTMKWVGGIGWVVAVAIEGVDVARAPNREQAAEATMRGVGRLQGAYLGGMALGEAGAILGPYGILGGTLIGGLAGASGVDLMMDAVSAPDFYPGGGQFNGYGAGGTW